MISAPPVPPPPVVRLYRTLGFTEHTAVRRDTAHLSYRFSAPRGASGGALHSHILAPVLLPNQTVVGRERGAAGLRLRI
jgi:hypothetical protein